MPLFSSCVFFSFFLSLEKCLLLHTHSPPPSLSAESPGYKQMMIQHGFHSHLFPQSSPLHSLPLISPASTKLMTLLELPLSSPSHSDSPATLYSRSIYEAPIICP